MSRPADPGERVPTLTLAHHFRRYAWQYAVGALALAATVGLGLYIPTLLRLAIDALNVPAIDASVLAYVARLGGLIALIALLQGAARIASRLFIFNAGRYIEFDVREELFRHLTRQPPSFFRRYPVGELMSRVTNDLFALRLLFGPGILNIVNSALFTAALWFMVRIDGWLTLMTLVPLLPALVAGRVLVRGIYKSSLDAQEALGQLSSRSQETLAGIAVVKAYGREEHEARVLRDVGGRSLAANMRLAILRGGLFPMIAGAGAGAALVVLWQGGHRVVAGTMSLGELVAFSGYLAMLTWPMMAVGWVASMWQRGTAAWARIVEVLRTEPSIADAPALAAEPEPAAAPAIPAALSVRGLTFAYEGATRPALRDVSFDVPPGATVAVVGRTGSGKSTLAQAIVRLVEIPGGAVFLDGADATRLPLARLRGAIGYVPQSPFLFSASLRENIAFADPRMPLERVVRAADAAGLARDVAAFPEGWDTIVGERGVQLSGGQRSRAALARAIAARPRLLILDDALAAVDAETAAAILDQLAGETAGATRLVISHRVAEVRRADLVLVLDEGRLVEQGRHDELLLRGGVYAAIYREGERRRALQAIAAPGGAKAA